MSEYGLSNLGADIKALSTRELIDIAKALGDSDPLATAELIRTITSNVREDFERSNNTILEHMTPEQLEEIDKELYAALTSDSRTRITMENGEPMFAPSAVIVYQLVWRLDELERKGGTA
jgi:hypothetical protein